MISKLISKIPFVNKKVSKVREVGVVDDEIKNAVSRTLHGMEQTMRNAKIVEEKLKKSGINLDEKSESRANEVMERMHRVEKIVNER